MDVGYAFRCHVWKDVAHSVKLREIQWDVPITIKRKYEAVRACELKFSGTAEHALIHNRLCICTQSDEVQWTFSEHSVASSFEHQWKFSGTALRGELRIRTRISGIASACICFFSPSHECAFVRILAHPCHAQRVCFAAAWYCRLRQH